MISLRAEFMWISLKVYGHVDLEYSKTRVQVSSERKVCGDVRAGHRGEGSVRMKAEDGVWNLHPTKFSSHKKMQRRAVVTPRPPCRARLPAP